MKEAEDLSSSRHVRGGEAHEGGKVGGGSLMPGEKTHLPAHVRASYERDVDKMYAYNRLERIVERERRFLG